MVNGKQHIVTWHVDDLNSSHGYPKLNDDFHKWLDKKYGSDDIVNVESSREKLHEYLAMTLDYIEEIKLNTDMRNYLDSMIAELPHKLLDKLKCPFNEKILKVNKEGIILGDEKRTIFHSFVIKAIFLTKQGCAGVQPTISFLYLRVK